MLSIIGGTGLYRIEGLEIVEEITFKTPFGKPSDKIIQCKAGDNFILFLPRHGSEHTLLPHEVNYRANIWALKALGADKIISVSATGSLREEIKPGDLAIPSQYFDHSKGKREYSFFGNGIAAHVAMANPTCEVLTKDIVDTAKEENINIHTEKTYACIEGPRLGTRAESMFLRESVKCDLVGMTNIPEVFLAREAQMAYATIAIATDYDCWLDDPNQHVSVEKVFEIYSKNINKVKTLLKSIASKKLSNTPEFITKSLKGTILTSNDKLSENQKEILAVLKK